MHAPRLRLATLLVTHDLNGALLVADRFVLLTQGRVLAEGGAAVLTPASIRAVCGMDSIVARVAGLPAVVPRPPANTGAPAIGVDSRKLPLLFLSILHIARSTRSRPAAAMRVYGFAYEWVMRRRP